MGGIYVTFERLEVIAFLEILDHASMVRIHQAPLHDWRTFGHVFWRTHIGPDHATPLARRIRLELDFVFEVAVGRLAGHVDTVAGGIELPAVVDAAQATFFVAAIEQRGSPVRAKRAHQADGAVGVAERDQVFTEDARAY